MALTAGSLIDSAKKRVFGALGIQKVSKAALLEELTYQDTQIVKMIVQSSPDLLVTTTGTITLTAAGNVNGYTLEDGIHYRDFTHVDSVTNRHIPINLLQRQYLDSLAQPPAATVRTSSAAAVFYPIDPHRKRWQTGDVRNWFDVNSPHSVTYSYVPLPQVITTLSSSLSSPDMAREALIESLKVAILISVDPPIGEEAFAQYQARLQLAVVSRNESLISLRTQVYKFINPQGQPGRIRGQLTDVEWVLDQVAR